MSQPQLVQQVLALTPPTQILPGRRLGIGLSALGLVGLGVGFAGEGRAAGWIALTVATALLAGLAVVGVLIAAIFQLSGARWGRVYWRLAEASVALMPVALVGLVALLIGGGDYLPWAHQHHLSGGKAVWLQRGFWDARLVAALLVAYLPALLFVYYSLRRDFCCAEVAARFPGPLARLVARRLGDDPAAEEARCESRLAVLAPLVVIAYALAMSLLAFDLIMALEPDWFSTLFGAWFFVGILFAGLALLALVSIGLRARLPLAHFFSDARQRDLATLLFAFCLLTADFFWNQYLTIWYGNLPEETVYLITRTVDPALPWAGLSWVTLMAFFAIPFVALLFRRVKQSGRLLAAVAGVVVLGVFLLRFVEVAPPLSRLGPGAGPGALLLPLLSAVLVFVGGLGLGLVLYRRFLGAVPLLPVGDAVLAQVLAPGEEHR